MCDYFGHPVRQVALKLKACFCLRFCQPCLVFACPLNHLSFRWWLNNVTKFRGLEAVARFLWRLIQMQPTFMTSAVDCPGMLQQVGILAGSPEILRAYSLVQRQRYSCSKVKTLKLIRRPLLTILFLSRISRPPNPLHMIFSDSMCHRLDLISYSKKSEPAAQPANSSGVVRYNYIYKS